MIAYLQKYDTTVEVPDDANESSLTDLNENFHSYVDQKPSGTQPESVPYNPEVQKFNDPPKPAEPPAPYKPNFYQSVLAPFKLMSGATDKLAAFSESNEGQAFGGKMVEGLSFGLMKPVLEHRLEAQYILNPDYAAAGQIVGDIGSLVMTGAGLKALGLGAKAIEAGKMSTSVMAAGERFIPRAIMSAATFGTHSFIKNTVQAFEDGKVDLEQFGKDVLTNTAFGGILGAIGGIANAPTAVASAGGLGFLSSKMHGGDNQEAGLNAAVWAAFETVGSFGRSEQLRMEAINRLKDSMGEYAQAREPGLGEAQARQVAGDFVDHAMRKEGYENAEEIAKSGPENLLEGIEKVNQLVRRGLVPNVQPAGAAELPKLPAPVSPEAEPASGAPAPAPAPTAVTPVQKAVDFVRGILGLPKAEPAAEAAPPITVKGDTYEEKIQSLKDQGHDISKMPESAFPDDMKDVYHFEQAKGQKAAVGQAVAEITGRLTDLGLKPEEQKSVFDKYGIGSTTPLGQSAPFYHGSGTGGIVKIDPNVTSHEGLFGQGFYVTDNPDVAKGYAKSRGSETGQSHLYRTILNKGNALDLESPLKDEFRDALLEQAAAIDNRMGYAKRSDYEPGDDTTSIKTSLEQQIRTGEIKTNQDLFRQFRERIKDASISEMIPTSEWVEDFQELNDRLRAKGYDAMTYQGGRRMGKGKYPPHKVMVVINPEMVSSLSEVNPSEATFVPNLINAPIEDQYKTAYRTLAAQRGIEGDKINSRAMEDAQKAVDLINGYFNPQSQMVFDFAKAHQDLSDHAVAQMAYDRGLIEEPNNDLLNVEIQKAKQEKIIQPGSGQGKVSASLAPQEPPQTPKGAPVTAASAQSPEVAPEKLFPGPVDSSYRSITADPSYVNMRQKAAEIAHRYAQIEGVPLTPEYAQTLFNHIHNLFEPVKNPSVPLAQRMEAAKALQAKYPDIENDFLVMKDQAYSDKTGPAYFERSVKGQRYLPEQPKVNYSIAGGGTVPRETTPRTPGAAKPAAAAEVSSRLKEAATEITDIVTPTHGAPLAAQITRENLGKMARSYDMAEAALAGAKKFFDSRTKEANLDFIDKMERGAEISATERIPKSGGKDIQTLRDIADQLRKLLDDKRTEIQALGTGKMQSFIENYFPHIWDQGEKQVSQTVMKAAKRPLEGSKSFLKKRSIEFTKDGIEMGLTPVSYNPVDLALLKIREMDKYLMAHRTIQEYKKNGLAKYVKIGGEVPEGWTKIDDRISTVFKSPMIAVKEAYDQKMMDDLHGVAKDLGIDLERKANIRKHQGIPAGAWGYSESKTPGEPGKITSKFAGPESVIAHELGHQLDNIYGLQEKFLSDKTVDSELTNLANERAEGNPSKSFSAYIQKPEEKMAVMLEAYIHAPELMKRTAPATYEKLETFLNSDPKLKPLTEIEPSLVLGSRKGEVSAGGAVIAGHIYAQPDAARIINNYLSPGLQKSTVYQAWRYAGNIINQFQLGMSAFHLGFTSVDASVSKLALSLMKLSRGEPLAAIKDALEVPFAPITNFIRGDELLKAWRGQGKAGVDEVLAEVMASAGGRARMDQFYATRAWEQMKHHFEAGRIIRGVLNIPMAIAEISSKPILEYIVPRQKLGIFADMIQMELNSHPDMTHSELREIGQKAFDSVDNRMGQLVYDNLFWNRTFKDLLMGSVRSVGWNLGTVRELGGGVVDSAQMLADLMRGKKTDVTYRTAYLMALPMLMGMVGAIAHYLMTGKGPSELKDYYYPKTGRLDANGLPERIALPSYMKDIYHYTQAPIQTVLNKLHPSIAMMEQMWANKDYYGAKIRNEDDPVVKQIASEAMFVAKQSLPFSVRNMQKNLQNGNQDMLHTIGPWVGITPAPYDINQTKAEKLAHEIAASHQEIGGRTQDQVDRSRLAADLTRRYRLGDPEATNDAFKAYQAGRISHRQMQEVITNSHSTPLQHMVKSFTLPEIERVYKAADDEEKAQLELILRRKELNQKREFVTPDGNPAE